MDNGDNLHDKGKPKKGSRPLSALDRLIQAATGAGYTLGSETDPASDKWPLTWDWLTRTTAGVDYVMTAGKVTVTAGPGGFIVTLTHPDLATTIEVTCTTLDGLFDQVEAKLGSPDLVVKRWGKKEPSPRKRKMK